ncbi:MDR family MFS transporter [Sporobolomyces salmoneus]|uniref:MDR family MFS transporter n=1 Tax=Sporobolomyces salmoneus TaxID=183962 RepID=UPI003172C015
MTTSTGPPNQNERIPAPIRATLAEPLEAASGRSTGDPCLSREIEENDRDRRSLGSVTHVDGSDRESEENDGQGKDRAKDGEVSQESKTLDSHHANGLQDQTAYLPVKRLIIVFASLQLAVFLSFLDQTIVSTCLPAISTAFDAGRSSSFVAAAYLLTSSAFQPIWARLSDVFGRKVTLIACVTGFAIGSLACAVAQTMIQLIVFRGIQGVGGGGLITLVLIIVSDVVSLKDRGKYQGITEMTILLGNGVGPILGAVFAQSDWRWAFWINLPLSAICIAVIFFLLPLKPTTGSWKAKLKQIDYGGFLLCMAGSVLVILPLNWGGTSFSWTSGPVLGCLISGVFTFVLFFAWEGKVAKIPVVPPFIFRQRTVATIFINTFMSGGTILSQIYYIPQYLQVARGVSPIRSGVLILPLLCFITLFVFFTGQLIARVGRYKPSICAGYAIWTVGLGLLSTITATTSDAKLIGYMVVTAVGQGQTLQSSLVAAQAAVQRSEMSVVTSTRNFMRSIGGTVFLVVSATIINNSLRSHLSPLGFPSSLIDALIDSPTGIWRNEYDSSEFAQDLLNLPIDQKQQVVEGYIRGFQTMFYVLTALIGFNFITATLFIEQKSLKSKDDEALKQKGEDLMQERKEKKANKGKKGEPDVEKGAEK